MKYPIIISHETRTGFVAFPVTGGWKVMFVGLNREVQPGEAFSLEDIERIKCELQFSSAKTMKLVADMLAAEAEKWERKE